MDLGTANTIIIKDDKIVLDEPSVVAFDNRTGEMIAVGTKAREMYEKGTANISTLRPLREGVIDVSYSHLPLRSSREVVITVAGRLSHHERGTCSISIDVITH